MNNIDRNKLIRSLAVLLFLCVGIGLVSRVVHRNSMTLTEYAALHSGTSQEASGETDASADSTSASEALSTEADTDHSTNASAESSDDTSEAVQEESALIGSTLNSSLSSQLRTTYTEGFYYEPLADNLKRYITGISYPAADTLSDPVISYDELRYVHILHIDYDGNPTEGELICNEAIAQDLVEIFYELYRNDYRLERVLLIDEYDGDDLASMEDNNTSCFNYRMVENSGSLSRHAYGLAIDINPLYNPYITYEKDGSQKVSPVSGQAYADRTVSFPYKIDREDLCYRLFIEHGFTWGGAWNNSKDYQHFQKAID